ncbi:chromosome replication initiation and membrane attachment protein [Entomoplasma ellychniae]|uniref:Chromosome replication initiation and membrane attachment protein n=1 Tax=Entomoplasma ellychniae TaxID=2114 RepID=A0A8E2QYN8_9MOLU|nr:DnaD domain protein [Entomoplasma ellychniae]PPE04704.1 chromosome replication initiation and membrane attachment protein [Entomoplasma ellychniae]
MSFLNKKYSVEVSNKISPEDHIILINLYQPLIGASAIGVYNTLIFESSWTKKMKSAVFEIERLVKLTKISEERLKTSLSKLTKLELLKVYKEKSTSNIVFIVNKPLSAKNFLNNHKLKELLFEALDYDNFESTMFFFKEKTTFTINEEYIDIEKELFDPSDKLLSQLDLRLNKSEYKNEAFNNHSLKDFEIEQIRTMQSNDWVSYYNMCIGINPNDITINAINKLKKEFEFNDDIVNCLIYYSYIRNNKNFIFRYVSKIAETIYMKKMNSVYLVHNFLSSIFFKKTSSVKFVESSVMQSPTKIIEASNVVLNDNIEIEW